MPTVMIAEKASDLILGKGALSRTAAAVNGVASRLDRDSSEPHSEALDCPGRAAFAGADRLRSQSG